MRKLLVFLTMLVFGTIAVQNTAFAHHPVVSGVTQCRTGDTWSVTWTARADADRDLTWRIISPAGYSPAGSQDDSLPFIRTASYPASQGSATETVVARWSNQVQDSRSATVQRPPLCEVPTTTTTSTTTTTTTSTTTTVPETTTTTTEPATTTTQPGTTTTVPVVTTTTQPVVTTAPPTTQPPAPTTTICTTGVTNDQGVCQPVGNEDTTVPPFIPVTGASDSLTLLLIAGMISGVGAIAIRIARR